MYNETHLEEFIQLLKLPAYILKLPLDDPKQVNTDCPLELVSLLLLPRKEEYVLIGPI